MQAEKAETIKTGIRYYDQHMRVLADVYDEGQGIALDSAPPGARFLASLVEISSPEPIVPADGKLTGTLETVPGIRFTAHPAEPS